MFRIVKGEEICRDAPPAAETMLAMTDTTEPDNTLEPNENSEIRGPVLYSFAAAGAPGRTIALRDGAPVVAGTDRILTLPAGIELFALVQDDGTLELFAYDGAQPREQDKLVLVASIVGYADDPSVFSGINRSDGFVDIADLIV